MLIIEADELIRVRMIPRINNSPNTFISTTALIEVNAWTSATPLIFSNFLLFSVLGPPKFSLMFAFWFCALEISFSNK